MTMPDGTVPGGVRGVMKALKRRLSDSHGRRPTVGLVGYFGWGNYGDELFVQVWQQELGDDFDLRVLPDLQGKPYFSAGIDAALRGVDAVLIGGGDLVIPWQLSELYWRREYLRVPVFIAGVGVPTSQQPKPHVVQRLAEFFGHPNVKYIHARDPESQEWIQRQLTPQVSVHEGPDLACALDFPAAPVSSDKVLGIVTREIRRHRDRVQRTDVDPAEAQQYDFLRDIAESMSQEGYEIRHIVLGAGKIGADDLADAQWADLPHARILHTASIDEMTSMLASCTALVTMKFHGAVVATMYGIPSFSFVAPGKPLSAKRVNFMRRIDRLDLVAPMSSLECVRALTGANGIDPSSVDMLRESSRTCISALRDEMRTVLLRR